MCFPNKTENVNINVFNMIARINESKTLPKHIMYEFKCNFDGRKRNSNQKWRNRKVRCECKNPRKRDVCEKDYTYLKF